jgi:hypothetical protein
MGGQAAVASPTNQNMINSPTIVPTVGVAGATLPVVQTDAYFAIEVDTTLRTEPTQIVLFDGSRGYQWGFQYNMPLDVTIRGLTASYEYIITDMVHNSSYFDIIKMRVIAASNQNNSNCCNSGELALVQFAHPIEVFNSSKGSRPRLLNTVYPDMGVHEGQFQLNINTFSCPTLVDNRTALVYTQEPGLKLVLGFYQKAELGRHQ